MLWREVDISTFPTETLWGWVDGLKEEMEMIRAEIDRRAEEVGEGSTDPADFGEVLRASGAPLPPLTRHPTDRGAPRVQPVRGTDPILERRPGAPPRREETGG